MILKQGMKLTQIHSFKGMKHSPDDFTKEGWRIEEIYSIRTIGTIYVLHSKKMGGFICIDEEALRCFFTNWTPWHHYSIIYNGRERALDYRTNYRIVEVRCGRIKAKATCHKADTFDLYEGMSLAFERAIKKAKNKNAKDELVKLLPFSQKITCSKNPEKKLIQINYMSLNILSLPAYNSIIHFTTYDENVSKKFDEHFNLFNIKDGLAEERAWQQVTNDFLGNNDDCDIMTAYGKNIITVFASERTPIIEMSKSAQKKIAKLLITELIEDNINYIALWEQEINKDFINILVEEAQNRNKKLDIAIAK